MCTLSTIMIHTLECSIKIKERRGVAEEEEVEERV